MIPGTNSSRVVRDSPRILEAFDPDLAIVMVGVNDFWTQPFEIGDAQGLERNLTTLSEQGEAFGVPLYFMTYPGRWSLYRSTNPIIVKVGEATGTPVIDLTRVFRTLCPERNCPRYLFPDQHPNANGYRIVAETVVARLAGSGRI